MTGLEIVVCGFCRQSSPCQHSLIVGGTPRGVTSLRDIAVVLASHGIWPPPHYLASAAWFGPAQWFGYVWELGPVRYGRIWLFCAMWWRRFVDWYTGSPPATFRRAQVQVKWVMTKEERKFRATATPEQLIKKFGTAAAPNPDDYVDDDAE